MAVPGGYGRFMFDFLFAVVAICSPMLVFLGTNAFLISNTGNISALASKTATPQFAEPQIPDSEALAVSSEVINYVLGGPEISHKYYFSAEELLHLSDVRKVVSKSFLLLKISAVAIILSLIGILALTRSSTAARPRLFRKLLFAAGADTLALAILAFAAFLSFDYAFTAFHLIFFQNSQWQFPYNFALVNLFTPDFFAAFARNIVAVSSAVAATLIAAAFAMPRFYGTGRFKARSGLKHEN